MRRGTIPRSTTSPPAGPDRPWDALAPFATGGVYLNFAGLGEESELRAATLGSNEARLDEIRRAYDPHGLFETAAHRP